MVEEMMPRKGSSSTHNPQLSTTLKPNKSDLISDLPNSLLLHILSLLNMNDVMQTTLLSRRWRYLWKSIPCLCFEPYGGFYQRFKLTYFIDRCLFHHEGSKIRKFHIIYDYEQRHAPLVDSWLHFAMKCKVEDFKLDLFGGNVFEDVIQYNKLYRLPRSLYLCTTLTSLNIRGCNLNLPDSFQFGSLKKLSLDLVELNPDSIEHFSSNCPSLEDIYLLDCNRKNDLNIVITNEHVKKLEISDYGQHASWNLKINAPTLLSLGLYRCYHTVRFHIENLASLMSVDLIGEELLLRYYDEYPEPDSDMTCFEKLLYDLRHVKHLKLCTRCLQVLSLTKLKRTVMFSISAAYLELKTALEKWELPGISYLLESCFNLEKLKIANEDHYKNIELSYEFIDKHDFEEDEYWASFETEVPSIMLNLKSIEIAFGRKSRHDEEFVRFLLKNAKVLESVVINTPKGYFKYDHEQMLKLSQRLHALPRSSPNAKLFIT